MGVVFACFIGSFITAFCLCACFLQRDKELGHEIDKRDREIAELKRLRDELRSVVVKGTAPAVGELARGLQHLPAEAFYVPGTEPGSLERAR